MNSNTGMKTTIEPV